LTPEAASYSSAICFKKAMVLGSVSLFKKRRLVPFLAARAAAGESRSAQQDRPASSAKRLQHTATRHGCRQHARHLWGSHCSFSSATIWSLDTRPGEASPRLDAASYHKSPWRRTPGGEKSSLYHAGVTMRKRSRDRSPPDLCEGGIM
jgi:hypothetical protein